MSERTAQRLAEIDPETDVENYSVRRLTAHIRDRFHEVHRRELTDAVILARRVEHDHAQHPSCPHGLADLLARLQALIEIHQRKEEAAIFPALMAGRFHVLARPLRQMAAEHAEIEGLVADLNARLDSCPPPVGAGVRWGLLHALCRKIVADLREHARLEDEILYPRCAEFAVAQSAR